MFRTKLIAEKNQREQLEFTLDVIENDLKNKN